MDDPLQIQEAVNGVLAAVSETVQLSDGAARSLRSVPAADYLVRRFEEAATELNATWLRLFRASVFGPAPAGAAEQLELAVDVGESARIRNEDGTIPSAAAPRLDRVNEEHMAEVERVLFLMSETRRRAERAARDLARAGADPHLVEALEQAERELETTIDVFFKGTYFHVPKDQLSLEVPASDLAGTVAI